MLLDLIDTPATMMQEPSAALDSAGAAEPTTITADTDALNVEAGGPVRVSSIPSAKPSVAVAKSSKSASGMHSA
jgi:hypothetical protein